jgi:hypothetical protein
MGFRRDANRQHGGRAVRGAAPFGAGLPDSP